MARRRGKHPKRRRRPEGVVSKSELSEAFHMAWEKCGHPRRNKRCWRRILRAAWADV
ncbi:MAG: TRAPP III-specific subunit 85 family protein [Desulfurococcales archaeon]|nr:TRAPP III-specific subunit 85 family protein [Desulfurococcales archaeon]